MNQKSNSEYNNLILCSYCKSEFSPSYINSQIQLKQEDKFNKLLNSIIQSGLFCTKCCRHHTSMICVNSQIPLSK